MKLTTWVNKNVDWNQRARGAYDEAVRKTSAAEDAKGRWQDRAQAHRDAANAHREAASAYRNAGNEKAAAYHERRASTHESDERKIASEGRESDQPRDSQGRIAAK